MSFVLPAAPTIGSGFAQGFGTGLSQTLPKSISEMFESRKLAKQGDSLEKQFGIPGFSKIVQTVGPEKAAEFYQNMLATQQIHKALNPKQISQEDQENFYRNVLSLGEEEMGSQSPEDLANLTPESESEFQKRQVHGFSPQERQELWDTISPENMQQYGGQQENGLEFLPEQGPFSGLGKKARKESELTSKENLTRNYNRIDEEIGKSRFYEREASDIKLLKNLNRSGKISSGLRSRIAVKDNQIVIPGQLTPEAERFLKTINRFANGAKDTFGGRVTNFDLQSYMAQLPSLLNSPEGRELIIRDMELHNEINRIYNSTIKQLGENLDVSKMSPAQFNSLVEKYTDQKIKPLLEEYEKVQDKISNIAPSVQKASSLESFNTQNLPKGAKAINSVTGETATWDGTKWQTQ